jgi:hypothetical protein
MGTICCLLDLRKVAQHRFHFDRGDVPTTALDHLLMRHVLMRHVLMRPTMK